MFIILTLYSAHNPAVLGSLAWEEYPTLRSFLEMCITNQFVFPPPTIAPLPEQAEQLKIKEQQISQAERKAILQVCCRAISRVFSDSIE